MRFAVETWAPEYGAPADDAALAESAAEVDPWVEVGLEGWVPRTPPAGTAPIDDLLFVDGVRRVEANVWIADGRGEDHHGICASYAAGAIRCNGAATLAAVEVRRAVFSLAEGAEPIATKHGTFGVCAAAANEPADLTLRLQGQMARLEVGVARHHRGAAEVVVVDGPLRDGHLGALDDAPAALVGFVKTHAAAYGPPIVRQVVAALGSGQRTPILLIGGPRPRFSWYLRLPGEVRHGWAGIVRLEATADQPVPGVVTLADRLAATLPRFASREHKDPRAPQNLYPIGGLERELRRRLGDARLLYRALRAAAATAA